MYNDSLITYYTLAAVLEAHILYMKKKTNTRKKKRPSVYSICNGWNNKIKITLGGQIGLLSGFK